MQLQSGSTVGPYVIERELGRGGMGIVFLAVDNRLDRRVAIKALPDHLVADPDRLARFEREAKIVASLHHPGIAAVYALEHDGPTRHLVMEYVEGETVADRLKRGPIPLGEALAIALRIAEALEAAHERGIVHRDLKPGNVMLTPDGTPKVLDFGLARAEDGSTTSLSGAALSQSPTMSAPIHSPTIPGAIMGTAGYMSPEQARGKAVDKRSDIFSFGCVVFEMLTGTRPFHGETVADALGATLHTDPNLALVPPDAPRRIRTLLARCLAKDPRERLRDIGEARILLAHPHDDSESTVPQNATTHVPGMTIAMISIAGLALGVLGSIGIMRAMPPAATDSAPIVASVLTPPGADLGLGFANPTVPRLSPDGRYLLFGGRSIETGLKLYLRNLRTGSLRALDGTENAQYPFWSPDSRSIGYFVAERGLCRIDIAGGAPRVLYEGEYGNGKGGSWNDEDLIVFSPGPNSSLFSVPAAGGEIVQISRTNAQDSELSHRHPFFLPGGDAFVYVRRNTSAIAGEGPAQIWVRTVDGSVDKKLVESMGNAQYSRGNLLYVVDGSLVARPFDERTLSFTGEARRIVDRVTVIPAASLSVFDATEAGGLAYVSGAQGSQLRRVVWRDRSGGAVEVIRENATIRDLRLIGDRSRILASTLDPASNDIVRSVIDLKTGRERTMEEAIPSTFIGCISPDGTRYAHWTNEVDGVILLVQPVDTLARPTVVARIPLTKQFFLNAWSADGKSLYGTLSESGIDQDHLVVRIDLDGSGELKTITENASGGHLNVSPSPDGRWLAFERIQRNQRHVYLMPTDHPEASVRLSETTAAMVRWRADSRELFFLGYDGVLSTVSIDTGADGQDVIGASTPLLDLGLARDPEVWAYDVSADGQRFLISEPMSKDETQAITIMTDWVTTMELK